MKQYLLDPYGYRGYGVFPINDDGTTIPEGDTNFTLEEYKELTGIDYRIVNEMEMKAEIEKFQQSRMKPFEEITFMRYDDLFESSGILRPYFGKDIQFFFIREADADGLNTVCCKYRDRYYWAVRKIDMSRKELIKEIKNIPWTEKSVAYENFSFEKLRDFDVSFFVLHAEQGEAGKDDKYINDIARSIIDKYAEEFGAAYLGNIQLSNPGSPDECRLVPYSGQMIEDGKYRFIVPVDDALLNDLLIQYNYPKKAIDPKAETQVLLDILQRIKDLKGYYLNWNLTSYRAEKVYVK